MTPKTVYLPRTSDDAWKLAGCGERCQLYRVTFPGRRYTEPLPIHDPHHHEAYGEAQLLRRLRPSVGVMVRTGPLEIDALDGVCRVAGEDVHLTRVEANLLGYLATNLGRLCHPYDVIRAVWGEGYLIGTSPASGGWQASDVRVLRSHLSRLRGKLGPARRLLVTDVGHGYRLLDEEPTG